MKVNYTYAPYNSFLKSSQFQIAVNDYNQNLRINKLPKGIFLKVHVKQDHVDFDKIEIISFLSSNLTNKVSSTTNYIIEPVNPQGWSLGVPLAKESTGDALEHSITFNVSELPLSWDGENTIKITVITTRLGITYKQVEYFNFLGIYESYLRNKSKIGFLQVTKRDD